MLTSLLCRKIGRTPKLREETLRTRKGGTLDETEAIPADAGSTSHLGHGDHETRIPANAGATTPSGHGDPGARTPEEA